MDEFRSLIDSFNKETGLKIKLESDKSFSLEYSGFIITLQYRDNFQDILISSPLTGSALIENVNETVMRSALKQSFGGFGTYGNFLGISHDLLVLSRPVSFEGLDAQTLTLHLVNFANALLEVRNRIAIEVMNVTALEENKEPAISNFEQGLNV